MTLTQRLAALAAALALVGLVFLPVATHAAQMMA